MGEPSTFFEDATQRFTIEKSGPDTMTVMGHIDSVFTYVISHTDLDSLPIASALDQQPIIIGKDLGLIRFFQIDSFPEVLRPLELIGNKGPDLGLHQITSASVHDYQPGDMVQYKTYTGSTLPNGQPFNFTKYTILSRSDTPDSVIYDVAWEFFNINGNYVNTGTSILKYSKHEGIAEIPFERFTGAFVSLTLTTFFCGLPIWELFRNMQPSLGPCEFGGCWVDIDTQGPPPSSYSTILLDVGTSSYFYQQPVYPWDPHYFDITDIVYFRKNGIECGVEVNVGIEELEDLLAITIAPDLSDGVIVISASQLIRSVRVSDLTGRGSVYAGASTGRLRLDLSGIAT